MLWVLLRKNLKKCIFGHNLTQKTIAIICPANGLLKNNSIPVLSKGHITKVYSFLGCELKNCLL